MDFVKALKEQYKQEFDFDSLFCEGKPGGLRVLEWLPIDDMFSLSIQASMSHYCMPRAYVDLEEYTHFELAIIYKDRIFYGNPVILNKFSRKDEFMEYFDSGVYTYVPKDLVQDLYDFLIGGSDEK